MQQMTKLTTLYDILQVSDQASPSVIRAAFKALSQKWHPDKHQDNNDVALLKFQKIKHAYDVLSNPESRQEYDCKIKNIKPKNDITEYKSKLLSNYYLDKENEVHISVIV